MSQRSEGRQPKEISALIALPAMLIVGALSIPAIGFLFVYLKVQEWWFVQKMRSSHRLMDWPRFLRSVEDKHGTVIEEWLSEKGPVRRWWTPDNIPANSPHPGFPEDQWDAVYDHQFGPFCSWCYANYTNGVNGKALLLASCYVPKLWDRTENLVLTGAIPMVTTAATARQRSAWAKPLPHGPTN